MVKKDMIFIHMDSLQTKQNLGLFPFSIKIGFQFCVRISFPSCSTLLEDAWRSIFSHKYWSCMTWVLLHVCPIDLHKTWCWVVLRTHSFESWAHVQSLNAEPHVWHWWFEKHMQSHNVYWCSEAPEQFWICTYIHILLNTYLCMYVCVILLERPELWA